MARKRRYILRIARQDGRSLRHEPKDVTEFFDLNDDHDFRRTCAKHYVPLACAAHRSKVYDRLRDMDFLHEYVLEVYDEGRCSQRSKPVATSKSTHGWR